MPTTSKLSRDEMIAEIRKCRANPQYFMETYVKIQNPKLGQVKLKLHGYQNKMVKVMTSNRFSIMMCSRQMGKTALMAVYSLWFALFHPDRNVLIVSNKSESASEIMDRIKYSLFFLPVWMRPFLRINNRQEIILDNNSSIKTVATSLSAGRGKSISLLICDEFAFVKDSVQDAFWQSIFPTVSTGGNVIIASTPNGDTNLFYRLWTGSITKDNMFANVMVKWDEHPERDDSWRKEQITAFGEAAFRQEYELEFTSGENTLVPYSLIQKIQAADPYRILSNFKFWIEPKKDQQYIVGGDISTGIGDDYSTIQVFTYPKLEQVAEFRDNEISPVKYYAVLKFIISYLVSKGGEVTWSIESNHHSTTIEELYKSDDSFPDAWMIREHKKTNGKRIFGMATTYANKAKACELFKTLVINNAIKINSASLLNEMRTFVATKTKSTKELKYEAKAGAYDDLISAMLIVTRIIAKLLKDNEELFAEVYSQAFDKWTTEDEFSVLNITSKTLADVDNDIGATINSYDKMSQLQKAREEKQKANNNEYDEDHYIHTPIMY